MLWVRDICLRHSHLLKVDCLSYCRQGCSKAAIGAILLDAMLRQPRFAESTGMPHGFGREFFRMHKDKIQAVWDGTKPTGRFYRAEGYP